jgi:hypothetical protein
MSQNLNLSGRSYCRPATLSGKKTHYRFPLEKECEQGKALVDAGSIPTALFGFPWRQFDVDSTICVHLLESLPPSNIGGHRRKIADHESPRFFGLDATGRHHPFPGRRSYGIALHVPIYRSQGESRQRHHPPWMRIRWRCRMN